MLLKCFVMSRGGDVQGNGFDMSTASSNGDVLDLQQRKTLTRLRLRAFTLQKFQQRRSVFSDRPYQ
jgi:hypothetical protein